MRSPTCSLQQLPQVILPSTMPWCCSFTRPHAAAPRTMSWPGYQACHHVSACVQAVPSWGCLLALIPRFLVQASLEQHCEPQSDHEVQQSYVCPCRRGKSIARQQTLQVKAAKVWHCWYSHSGCLCSHRTGDLGGVHGNIAKAGLQLKHSEPQATLCPLDASCGYFHFVCKGSSSCWLNCHNEGS